ncbi:MBL fold metallo-hydrolase [Niastella yeongjuensis]|uniref:MBL fold metallo-hydrolase n=1 Tax=Niastella yeongjuensis TaxID=354355 RepID=A0A1V9EIR9_9BACT|nr:MBL fold metallo-hydrolase [Niastella yeongjuensis]OQP46023.1 MBL fold metallo-hydrolase [Niastella yeongjuensis]SEP18710.1 L-ascorbate metabolism protein UlaG, beta-lactamase superfamily [Niastella yeongjuensis]
MKFLHPAIKEGKKFLNPVPTNIETDTSIWAVLWKYMTNKAETTPKKRLGPFATDVSKFQQAPASGLRITWVGHSSLLIEIDGLRLLTDPVWSARASFSQSIGPKRFFPAPLSLQNLPPLDAIIISHDHYDHLDKHVIPFFANSNVPFYCSVGVGQYLQEWGIQQERIKEMTWMDSFQITPGCKLTALPARHFSGRKLTNRFETLWSSFAIKTANHNIYYGADSGWYDGFFEIGDAYGPFDLTMLEIGAYNTSWADIHMGPDHATNAHLALKGKLMMPIHWGTFNLALHPWYEPIERILALAKEKQVQLFLPKPGEPTEVTGAAYNSHWWV